MNRRDDHRADPAADQQDAQKRNQYPFQRAGFLRAGLLINGRIVGIVLFQRRAIEAGGVRRLIVESSLLSGPGLRQLGLIWRVVRVGRWLRACRGRSRFALHVKLSPTLTAKTRRTI